ncbi:YihY/virulence factor BrkB family protein [Oecophyllibacter saccharovorans]|uniref:YihY/virulence factor BrkB family protein n=1 Tax=Oecophyllibacter saccharovorans TaxID=2558360 RepID=UPI001F4F1A10|nr:YihY/virulence factor BrkB family protein [Oecophyllibacter saccharovorans]
MTFSTGAEARPKTSSPQSASHASDVATASGSDGATAPVVTGGWKSLLRRIIAAMSDGTTSLAAAGCAFFATLSLFPALTALISVYGLVFDLQTIEPQLEVLKNLLPPAAYTLITNSIHTLVMQPHSSLTLGLVFSLTIVLWSASASSRSILQALNMVYHTRETRGVLYSQLMALAVTITGIIGACLTLALMVAAPAIVDYLPRLLAQLGVNISAAPAFVQFLVQSGTPVLIHWLAPIIMVLFVFTAVTLLYRFAPCRSWTRWRWILPGSIVATVMWVITSLGFSWYVAHFASYGTTYGPLGAVAAVMMWMFVSAYVVLFGATVDAEIEERGRAVLESEGFAVPPEG